MATCLIAAGTGSTCKVAGGVEAIWIASIPTDLVITPDRATGGQVTDIDDTATALVFYKFEMEQGTMFFKENTVGDISLGFEKTSGGMVLGYTDAMNVLLEPVLRGKSIAIAKDNNGNYLLQGDMNPLRSVPAECGIAETADGLNGYNLSLKASDGFPMRQITTANIVPNASDGSITITGA